MAGAALSADAIGREVTSGNSHFLTEATARYGMPAFAIPWTFPC
jgi:hypothetical protein